MNLYCNKCGSKRVEDVVLDLPEPKDESIDEWVKKGGHNRVEVTTLEMKYYKHRVTCLDCGYSRTYVS